MTEPQEEFVDVTLHIYKLDYDFLEAEAKQKGQSVADFICHELIIDHVIHRALVTVGNDICKLGFGDDVSVDEAIEAAEAKIQEAAKSWHTNINPNGA